jgi:hypothetical protein
MNGVGIFFFVLGILCAIGIIAYGIIVYKRRRVVSYISGADYDARLVAKSQYWAAQKEHPELRPEVAGVTTKSQLRQHANEYVLAHETANRDDPRHQTYRDTYGQSPLFSWED